MSILHIKIFKTAQAYEPIYQAMKALCRTELSNDILWILEHQSVYTLGQAGDPSHVLNPSNIPVVHTDRGGQVTYHGPGQLMAYTLFNLKTLGIGVRRMVIQLEQSVISLLQALNIDAHGRRDAPGVYVGNDKIASIGLRVRHGRSYHGLSLNVNMDTKPFSGINPCGYPGLKMIQCADFVPDIELSKVRNQLINSIAKTFQYKEIRML